MFDIISKFFKDTTLGGMVSITSMANSILNIQGVSNISTIRTDTGHRVEGMQLVLWNPIYPAEDVISIGSDHTLPYYKYAYLNDPTSFVDKISVIPGVASLNVSET